jgi:hypothetical protein
MKAGFLQLFGVILFPALWLARLDVVLPPADVAPPPVLLLGLGLGALIALGAVVLVVVVVAIFVIRAIKKNNAAKNKS